MRVAELGEFIASKTGSTNPSNFPNEQFEYYSIPAYDNGEPEVTLGISIGSSKKNFLPGDVLLSRIVPHIRRCWIVQENNGYRQIGSGEWIVFRTKDIAPSFLRFYLMSDEFNIKFMKTIKGVGGSLMRADPNQVKRFKISLPPLEEQKKIAAILDAADEYRQKTKALIDKYDQLTQSLFLDMFGDSNYTERAELANIVSEKRHFVDGPFGSNLKVSDQTERGVRLIQVNNIGVGEFRDKTSRFTSVEKYETLKKHEVIPGDLVVAKMGEPLGRCCILPHYITKALVVADCMRIRVSSPDFISKYVMFFLNSYDAKQQIKNLSRGSTRVRINLSMLRKLKIPKPTVSSQNEFAERVSQIEKQKQQAEASLVKAEELFSSLLQRAFKGELTS